MASFILHNAEVSFGEKEVLKEISFSLNTGEILGIFGKNGSGKSTFLKMIFGTLRKASINFSIDDKYFKHSKNITAEQIAYLPKNPFLPINIEVRDIIPIYFSEEKSKMPFFMIR